MLPDTVDVFNEKVIRSADGATFRLPFRCGSASDLQQLAVQNNLVTLVADIDGEPVEEISKCVQPLGESFPDGVLLVLGSEARGPSSEILKFCRPIGLSMSGSMESLNVAVAAGIFLHLLPKLWLGKPSKVEKCN